MKEVKGNLWTYPADVRVITTNGTINLEDLVDPVVIQHDKNDT